MPIDALIVGGSFRAAKRLEAVLADEGLDTVIATRDGDAIDLCRMTSVGVVVLQAAQDSAAAARLCAALRAANHARRVSILAVTCTHEPWQDLSLLDAGSDDCLSLPDEMGAFCARVRSLHELGRLRSERMGHGCSDRGAREQRSRAIRVAVVDPDLDRRRQTALLLTPDFTCAQIEGPTLPQRVVEASDVILLASSCLHGTRGIMSRPASHIGNQSVPRLLLLTEPGEDPANYQGLGGIDDVVMRPMRVATTRARIRCLAARCRLSSDRLQAPADVPPGTMDSVTLPIMDRRRAA